MDRIFKGPHWGRKCFRLIDLLLVIAILVILAAVAVPNVSKIMN